MPNVIAFRARQHSPDEAEAPPSSVSEGNDAIRGQLVIFPGVDFFKVLQSFGTSRPPRRVATPDTQCPEKHASSGDGSSA